MSGSAKFSKILVIDIEATCYENGIFPDGEEQEIIEIGVAVLDTVDKRIYDNRSILIRPTRSQVSEYCTDLTTLTIEKLRKEGAKNFEQGLKRFVREFGPKRYPWASWGNSDKWAFERECGRWNIPYPFGSNHFNVKAIWKCMRPDSAKIGYLGDAVDYEGLPKEGQAHRGYVDALWTAEILNKLWFAGWRRE